MTPTHTRIPYGMAKRIVATMRLGDACVVRPEWVVSFHNAARRLGVRVAAVSFTTPKGEARYRILRIAGDWPTGHRMCRVPRRDQISGRWLRDRAA